MNLAEALMPYGIEAELAEDDLIVEAVVLAKVHTADGTTTLQISSTEGCDWIAQFGLVAAAWHVLRGDSAERAE
jgi:hypothetical protein